MTDNAEAGSRLIGGTQGALGASMQFAEPILGVDPHRQIPNRRTRARSRCLRGGTPKIAGLPSKALGRLTRSRRWPALPRISPRRRVTRSAATRNWRWRSTIARFSASMAARRTESTQTFHKIALAAGARHQRDRSRPSGDHRPRPSYCPVSNPTITFEPVSNTGLLIIEGCASISVTALSSVRSCRSASGSFRKVVPARFSSFSQPTLPIHARSFSGAMPLDLVVVEDMSDAALIEKGARLLHRVAILDAVDVDHIHSPASFGNNQ